MTTGAYYISYNYEMYCALGTTASAIPTSTSGLTRIFNLADASVRGSSETTNAIDYETGVGGRRDLITQVGYSLPAQINVSLTDPGYHILHRAWLQGASGTLLRWFRKTPITDSSTDDFEYYAGLAFVEGFEKSEAAGTVATVTFNFAGYGAIVWRPQGRAAATFTIATAGSGLTNASYTDVALIGTNGDNGVGTGALADITVAGGVATVVALGASGGSNYNVNDVLTCAVADIGGTGTAPTFTVATVAA